MKMTRANEDAIRAVLAFVDGGSMAGLPSVFETTTRGVDTTPAPNTSCDTIVGKRRRGEPAQRADKRQREELIALREATHELQDRLAQLKNRLVDNHRTANKQPEGGKDSKLSERRQRQVTTWQAIAETQKIRRETAESERKRLQALIEEQRISIRRLRRYIRRHTVSEDAATLAGLLPLSDHDDHACDDDSTEQVDEAHFVELSRATSAMYLQSNALFTSEKLKTVVTQLREVTVQNVTKTMMSVEVLDSRVVPFDVATTAKAVWQHHMTKSSPPCSTRHEQVDATEDAIRRRFLASRETQNSFVKARACMETRRYREEDRVVIVQSAMFDEMQLGSTDVPDFAVRYYQWTVIQRPRNSTLRHSGRRLCQVETFGVGVPTVIDYHRINEGNVREAMEHGCSHAITQLLEFERHSVDSILMDEMLQGPHVNSLIRRLPSL